MALTPEIRKALSNATDWQNTQSHIIKMNTRVNASLWILEDINLSGFIFMKCDFQGARIVNANLDNCEFKECTFSNCVFENISFVGTQIFDCKFNDSEIKTSVVRRTLLNNCIITDTIIHDIELSVSKFFSVDLMRNNLSSIRANNNNFESCSFELTQFDSTINENVMFKHITFSKCEFTKSEFIKSELIKCEFSDISLTNIVFQSSNAHSSKVVRSKINKSNFTGCNFISGTFICTDLNEMQINAMGFLDSSFIECIWPNQAYTISFMGKYRPSPNLLRQPVEDIRGLSPTLRSVIRRSQLVDEMVKNERSFLKKMGLWFWAVTSAYGRSLTRLTTLCLAVILFFSILFVIFSYPEVFWANPIGTLIDAIKCTTLSLVGIEYSLEIMSRSQKNIIITMRFIGLVFFGLWIGVAANKFGTPK